MRDVSALIPFARNSRTHSDVQVAQIAASIREFGWTSPILIDGADGLIAGHGRLLAARKLGIEQVPVIPLDHLNEAQKRALVIADNKLALNAGWDLDLLSSEIEGLGSEGFDLSLLGFDDGELGRLLADQAIGLTDPDAVPDVPADPVSVAGDVWLLGQHRLVCGDCTEADVVAKALGRVEPHLMVTDPPYGVEYEADWRNKALRANGKRIGGRAVGKVANDDRADWRGAWALFPGSVAYVWHGGLQAGVVADSLMACGFVLRSQIIWAKQQLVIGRGDYHWQHEPCWMAERTGDLEDREAVVGSDEVEAGNGFDHDPCWYAVRTGAVGRYQGGRKQSTVWSIDKPQKSGTGHSTQKPVECMKRPIENNSSRGQAVYDPFVGSGTTIIAGEMTGRAVFACEIHPAYVDVAILRWQAFTGRDAVLEASGEAFAELADERVPVRVAVPVEAV